MDTIHNIFIIGAKCIGQYGGYETFLDKLTEYHQKDAQIRYHIVCKANGDGCMDETKLSGVKELGDGMFFYHRALCVKLPVPQIGAAQAIVYDLKALDWCIRYCRKKKIEKPVFYVLACRIGPFIAPFAARIHKLGGVLYVNPDGLEYKRAKWSPTVRKYWKKSEQLMVKHADLLVCDSINIEKHIRDDYGKYDPQTTFIAYGSETRPSHLADDDERFTAWLSERGLAPGEYYMCCGRFVPENSFETMISEFMRSNSRRKFAIITTANEEFLAQLEEKLHFSKDPRICFAGTVYDPELLKKIRENAYANFHGHTVGGTNPSLLEALGSTEVNLLIDVGFNREVAEDAALYWSAEEGSLSALIDQADRMTEEERHAMGEKAKDRIRSAYSWEFIASEYKKLWERN